MKSSTNTLISRRIFPLVWILFFTRIAFGQIIQFSIYIDSELNANKEQDMSFGTLIQNQGNIEINLGDPGCGVFSITGNEEMDVTVTMTPPPNLTNTGPSPDVIPFTMDFAYANNGENDVNQAKLVTGTTVRFKIKEREEGPAGPPPTPPNSGYTPADATAYIYVMGSMNVGNIDTGEYTGTVTLTVEYE